MASPSVLNLTWHEDPFHDRTWQLREQSARFTLDLMQAWHVTGNLAYRDRALALLLDWVKDNPQSNPPSEFSWIDHGPALRATVLACAYRELGAKAALLPVVLAHGRLLADPSFYRGYSNHALDQSIGLFDIAVQVGRTDWRDLAVSRMGTLLAASVDSQGVTNEQSIGYEYYNWSRYSVARRRIAGARYRRARRLRPDRPDACLSRPGDAPRRLLRDDRRHGPSGGGPDPGDPRRIRGDEGCLGSEARDDRGLLRRRLSLRAVRMGRAPGIRR